MSEWAVGDKHTVSRMNQKTIVVKATTPTSIFVGQLWFDTTQNRYKVSRDGTTFVPVVKGIFAVDDTQKSVTGTTETEVKNFRYAKTSYTTFVNFRIIASLWTSNAAGTAYLKIYVDGGASPSLTLQTTSTSETVLEGDIDISGLTNGIHTFRIKISNSSASYTTYTEYLAVFVD
jgi:hypothetical protein